MPYTLKRGVHLVEGALNGAILDTNTGNVYSVNSSGVAVIQQHMQSVEYWQSLASIGLAEFKDETLEPAPPQTSNPVQHGLRFVWFELVTQACNERCIHCYVGSMPTPPSKQYARHATSHIAPDTLSYQEWQALIQECLELGCTACQFIGGEPFLYKDGDRNVLDLAEWATVTGYEFIEIYTNATLLDKGKIERIRDLNLSLAVSLYSHVEEIHDAITRTPGSFQKTVSSLKQIKKHGISTRVEVIAMRQNEHHLDKTADFISQMGFEVTNPDPIRPTGRGIDLHVQSSPETLIKYGCLIEPDFKVDTATPIDSSYHSCLAGKIAILENGDILPCVFSRNHVIANTRQRRLKDIIDSQAMQTYWHLSKDDVLVCKDCE